MRRVDVVTIGSAVKDVMFYSDDVSIIENKTDLLRQKFLAIEYGAKIDLEQVFVTYGGGAMNVAVGLRNFGLKVAPMVCLGKDWVGREFLAFIKEQRMPTDLVQYDDQLPTGFSVVITAAKDHEHTIFTYKGASTHLQVPERISRVKTSWFYIGPLSMRGWIPQFEQVMQEVKRHQQRPYHEARHVLWTPGHKQVAELGKVLPWLPFIDVMVLNKDEAIEICLKLRKKTVIKSKLNQSRYLLDCLKALGMKNIVVTAGAKGAYGIDVNGRYYYKPSVAVKVIDTVGAGDSFSSGFLAAYHRYHDFGRALDLGVRNSAACLTRVGAQNGLLQQVLS